MKDVRQMIKKDLLEFKKFWYITGGSASVFAYIIAVTFLPIPEQNIRFVDTCLGFLLGTVLGGGWNYLTGAVPENSIKGGVTNNVKDSLITQNSTNEDPEK